MATIKWETADNMMNIAAFIATRACSKQGAQIDLEAIGKFARDTFQEYCDIVGITEVEYPEEENSEAFDDEERTDDEDKYCDSAADDCFCNSNEEEQDSKEEVDDFDVPTDYWSEFDEDNGKEDDDDSTVYYLTAKGEFVLRYMQYGHSLEEASKIADILFGEGE